MNRSYIYNSFKIVSIAVLCLVSFIYLLESIQDPDFFWHLKTGEWIWEHKSLPSEDPFTYTSSRSTQTQTIREHVILTSYWLSQVIYHLFHFSGGMLGIVFLRFIIVGILIFFMLKRKHGDSILYLSLLIIFLIQLLGSYPIERPQAFSFLFFAILLCFLEKVRDNMSAAKGIKIYFLVSLLMLIWSNMHGGYILGQVLLILYVIMEGLKFIHPSLKPLQKNIYKKLVIVCGLGIIFSLFNPNIYNALTMVITAPSSLKVHNLEYQSSLWRFRELNEYIIILYWLILLITIIVIIVNLKKIDITVLALLIGTGFFSFTTARYIPFFMIAALPIISILLSKGIILKLSRIFIFAIMIYAAVFFTWKERLNVQNISSNRWINTYEFPVTAADFILNHNIKGRIYNNFEWGGYLIWRLGPERKVFIDGRVMYEDVYEMSTLIDNAYSQDFIGLPYWKAILNSYSVRCIILPLVSPSGNVPELLNELIKDNAWSPVFLDRNSMIFLKNTPENHQIIKINAFPKYYFITILIDQYKTIIRVKPTFIQAYIAMSDLYIMLNRFQEAREGYEKVLQIAPFNNKAREMLKLLDMKRDN
jgi:hypothetical protein